MINSFHGGVIANRVPNESIENTLRSDRFFTNISRIREQFRELSRLQRIQEKGRNTRSTRGTRKGPYLVPLVFLPLTVSSSREPAITNRRTLWNDLVPRYERDRPDGLCLRSPRISVRAEALRGTFRPAGRSGLSGPEPFSVSSIRGEAPHPLFQTSARCGVAV